MAFPRTQHQLTVLPDGTVLATGGSRNSDVNDPANAVLAAELWDPTTETWRTLSSGVVPRLYHSSATLLPDGRVAIGGGGHPPGFGIAEFRSEIFSPPYLFKGARPTITSAPTQANYGQSFFVGHARRSTITKVALIPQPTPTHAFNSNSGYVPLTFSQTAGGLTVRAPRTGTSRLPACTCCSPSTRTACRRSPPGCASPHRAAPTRPPSVRRGQSCWGTGAAAPRRRRRRLLRLPTPPVPTASAPTSVFGDLTPRATVPGESFAVGSYGKRLVCTLNGTNKVTRGPPDRAPP